MRVLVADDEAPARRILVRLLEQLGGIEVVAEAADGLEVLAAVGRTAPELVLLDIDMPELDGLALAASHRHLPPVVFVTAHDAHAMAAFDVGAIDYVLKPVRLERLATALARVRERTGAGAGVATRDAYALLSRLRHQPPAPAPTPPRVTATDRGALLVFDATEVDRFRAAEKYTAFVAGGAEHLTDEPLVALEERLRAHGFVRVHRGELVRVAAIRALHTDAAGHEVRLADGQRVRVSRRFLPALKAALGI